MKISLEIFASVGMALAVSSPLLAQDSHGDPFTPVGFLTVTPTVVQPGVQPEMDWGIQFPKSIPDLVVIDTGGGMTTTNDKSDKVTVRVAGVSVPCGETGLETALWIRINNGAWNLVFYGNRADVDPGEAVYSQTIQPGTRVDFSARAKLSEGVWSDTIWTLDSSTNLQALIDDDPVPTITSAFANGQVESFMTQFIDSGNEIVAGPRDVIHLFEFGSSNPSESCFDLQDLVVVTNFGKNNNGHGNNDDGVDMSNPGDSSGIAGSTEMDPYVDDEKSKIKRKSN